MGIRDELLKIAELIEEPDVTPKAPESKTAAAGIRDILSKRKQENHTKIAIEVTDLLVEKGVIDKNDYQDKLNSLLEHETEKLAGIRDTIESGIIDRLIHDDGIADVDSEDAGEIKESKWDWWFEKHGR